MNDQIFGSGLNLGGQQYAMVDEPPPPVSGNKPPAAPIRPVPMRGTPAPLSPQIIQSVKDQTLAPRGGNPSSISTDPEKFNKLMEGIQAGKGQRTIAKELGIGRSSVQRYLQNQLNVKESPGVVESFWKPEKTDALKKLYLQGHSQAEMARQLGTETNNIPFQLEKLKKAGELPTKQQPSLPKFEFRDHPGKVDADYVRALEKYLKDIHSWIATNSNTA
jgi:transposase